MRATELLLRVLVLAALLLGAATLAGCGGWQAEGDGGWVLMEPRTDEEAGFRGLWPAELPEDAAFVAVSVPMTRDEFVELTIAESNLYAFPEPVGNYQGDWLQWDLYSFYARFDDLGPEMLRAELALATQDGGGAPVTRYVGLVALPEVYEEHAPMLEAVYLHALDAAAPLE